MSTSTTDARTQQTVPTLVGIRAAHHPTYDRIVFDFAGGVPAGHDVRYVPALVGDASGLPIPLMARAILQVRFSTVEWVKIYDPRGSTGSPTGSVDSIPESLEP